MFIIILIAIILPIVEAFLYKKTEKLSLILPIITGIYMIYSCYKVIKFEDLTFIDMLPSLAFFIPTVITVIVCKKAIKKS